MGVNYKVSCKVLFSSLNFSPSERARVLLSELTTKYCTLGRNGTSEEYQTLIILQSTDMICLCRQDCTLVLHDSLRQTKAAAELD
jgi:hypothetical protein